MVIAGEAKGLVMTSLIRLLIFVVVLAVAVFGTLFYFGESVDPQVQTVEKVLPDDQFPK